MVSWNYVEILLAYCSKPLVEIDAIRDRLTYLDSNWNEFAEIEYYDIIETLNNNQLDKISNGLSYNQTDIKKHLNKLR